MVEVTSPGNLNFTKINKALLTPINKVNDSVQELSLIKYIISFEFTTRMDNHTLFGTLILNDYDGIMNNEMFTITGEEFVIIEMENIEGTKFYYKFVVGGIDLEVKNESGDSALLILSLVSVDFFSNSFLFKSRGYVNLNITDIVKKILDEELRSEIPLETFEDTLSSRTFAFTKIRPFEKIEILQQQSYSKNDYLFSKFFFYETKTGYNFRSFEDIIKKSNANTTPLTYYYSELSANLKIGNPFFRNIKKYEAFTRSNNFERIINGFYSGEVQRFDFNTKRVTKELFSMADDIKKFVHVGTDDKTLENLSLNVSENFSKSIGKSSMYTYFLPWNSEDEMNDLTYKYYQYTKPFNHLLKENTLNIIIDGTFLIELGDPLIVEITDNNHPNDMNKNIDMRYSGRYIVHGINHIIQQKDQFGMFYHDMCVSLVRDLMPISQTKFNEKTFNGYDIKTLQNTDYIS
mgnify:CR=1 FL=1|jgi:hypothetical protein